MRAQYRQADPIVRWTPQYRVYPFRHRGTTPTGRKGNARPRPEVRAIHQAAVIKGRSQAHANKRAALDAAARELGHLDWKTFICDTMHPSVNQVG
ncbi:hypothetical protein ACFVYE_46980 [Streptomyces sp. NPDC058239]|uniref:hypothetical protein n=1 Tax=Streptomyces sp. NPDC058239 TaxID=3346395 RepID=UPI0036EA981B